MKRRASLLLFFCSYTLLTAQGFAWGPAAHRWITNRAMDNLEGPFQELLGRHRSTVVQQTMGPDYRKDQDPEEPSRHFIDLELYGKFPLFDFDLNYDRLVGRLGKETVEKTEYCCGRRKGRSISWSTRSNARTVNRSYSIPRIFPTMLEIFTSPSIPPRTSMVSSPGSWASILDSKAAWSICTWNRFSFPKSLQPIWDL